MQREITDVWLRGLKPPATVRLEVWDTRTPNLVLRMTPGGTATWSVRTRTKDGKRTRPTIGTWPAIGIQDARRRALALAAEIAGGGDPVADKRALQAERKARAELPTVASRLAEWQGHKARNWSARYAAEVKRLCDREIVPRLGGKALAETVRADWTDVIARVHRRAPGVGALLYRICSAFLGHAEGMGWIPAVPLPRKGLQKVAPPVAARKRTLSDAELVAIWRAADIMRPKPRLFVRLLVMTAARKSEAADIATGEVDLEACRWTIPGARTKNGLSITLPLHELLVADLKAVWPEHGPGPEWRLLGAIRGSGLRGFSPLKRRLDKAAGTAKWRLHDIRRTCRTGLTRLGVARDHAEAALNHISGRTALERTYDRHDYADEVIAAAQRWQAYVAALVTTPPSAEIVSIAGRRWAS